MSTIVESVDVDVPVRAAYDQWTQFETSPRFMEGVEQIHRLNDTTTRVTAQMEIDPEGFAEKAADRLGAVKGRVKGDMQRFKTFIEERKIPTGAWRGQVDRPH
ncbi:SRPBCC family protein [Actinomadura rugatobispora]|uniref:SRPBCC family protein n=1 Tax=Actinomadura rugatobispora TaxID=1994 RepID=A0ABW0ZYU0_9ACTN|nr:SRPBCC family protein [Actinomadura rugatobispora]